MHARAANREEGAPPTTLDVAPVGSLVEVGVFQLALRLCREFEEKKHWLQLGVTVSFLKQLFCFLDQMIRHGDEETNRVAVLLRRNVFYEGEVTAVTTAPFRARGRASRADCSAA